VKLSPHLYRFLDKLAANAWPAQVQQAFGGWRLRANNGLTRRANSVLTAAPTPDYPEWLSHIEDFYERRALVPRFQVSDGSPDDLAPFLGAHGYRAEAYTMVQTALAQEVVERAGILRSMPVIETESLTEEWLDAFLQVEGVPDSKKATYRSIYAAIGPRTTYLRACSPDGTTISVGMAVTERGWTGLFSIATLPEYRGQGLATQILSLLARWSLSNDAPNLYLQVMEDNEAATRLYEKLGFVRLYGYHYRTKG
jgi:ribosomal protein S18 acetylase RimI-like enzyme